MSAADSLQSGSAPGRSPGLTLNLQSNNPFRNRAASPVDGSTAKPLSPNSPFDQLPPRPVSRNPFLDPAYSSSTPSLALKPADNMSKPEGKPIPSAEELFGNLTIDDKRQSRPTEGPRPPMNRPPGPPRGGENMAPRGRGPPPRHRPTRSQEEAMRARRMAGNGPRPGPSQSPQRREQRPRRNSESSLAPPDRPLTDEEKKEREARRRERERRQRDGKDKPKAPNRKLDIIDQLDATSIFGTGLFHHDGPFDALNPHRNKKGARRAPMQAFPKDSLNNSLGGSGPVNARPDHATFMGNNGDEAFKDYAQGGGIKTGYDYPQSKGVVPVFDPMSRGSVLHGDESLGLGTSTFLEGTPAARTAIQRREQEQQQATVADSLQRKKSLAQRIRNINKGPRDVNNSGRLTNPEGVYGGRKYSDSLPLATSRSSMANERNPFFDEYTKEPEDITVRRTKTPPPGVASPTSPLSPPQRTSGGLERRATAEASSPTGDDGAAKTGGGLLARVKSLKGGRRARISDAANHPPPGTAA